VGLYAGNDLITAEMPVSATQHADGGRAVGREHLDTLLLDRAAACGAHVMQPWTLSGFTSIGDQYHCHLAEKSGRHTREIRALFIVAAHGSWESGPLPTQVPRRPAKAADLFGFKAHFLQAMLPADLMPLIAFPGGYGGMVHTDGDRVSLSCCIRRDQLEMSRRRWPHIGAGAAVVAHINAHCKGVADALAPATLAHHWISSGPLRTGIRNFGGSGIFAVGNAVGEAHPIVAEGISMAIQSSWLLCDQLVGPRDQPLSREILDSVHNAYEVAWRRNFSRRIQMAALYAHLFMRPLGARMATAVLRRAPQLLNVGAQWSGKTQALQHVSNTGLMGALGHRVI
jgi:flavin-dependent dehydrogenase